MAVMQAITVKHFTYRGNTEEYSNVYHLSGTQPADSAAWDAVLNSLRNAEVPLLPNTVTWTDGYGYNPGHWESKPQTVDRHLVWTTSNVGTLTITGGTPCPGDDAVWVRWDTGDRNTRGKPIYLRKYFHPAIGTTATSLDNVLAAQSAALTTYGAKFTDGTSIGGGLKICRPNGHLGGAVVAGQFTTTRTLKRRGKRPAA
jgi:hypothetical protein